jgi:D-glycero-D-manno-heptose 1,7-bisphosphate phosphatase
MANEKGACAVFLDRDGVINEVVFRQGKPASPRSLEEFRFCEAVEAALEQLAEDGFRLFVVSNQPDVARGLLAPSVLQAMSDRILASLPIERVLTCVHDDADGCSCRKPKPGMLHTVASSEGINLQESFLVGDSRKDMQAGAAAGCMTILLQRPYNQGVEADYRVASLGQAVGLIVGELRHAKTDDFIRHRLSR